MRKYPEAETFVLVGGHTCWAVAPTFAVRADGSVDAARLPPISPLRLAELKKALDWSPSPDPEVLSALLRRFHRAEELRRVELLGLHVGGAVLLRTMDETRIVAVLPEMLGLLCAGDEVQSALQADPNAEEPERGAPLGVFLHGVLIAVVFPLRETLDELDAEHAEEVALAGDQGEAWRDVRAQETGLVTP